MHVCFFFGSRTVDCCLRVLQALGLLLPRKSANMNIQVKTVLRLSKEEMPLYIMPIGKRQ
jgi:UDP-N-acetylglucosamine enolpyruvyl transferase